MRSKIKFLCWPHQCKKILLISLVLLLEAFANNHLLNLLTILTLLVLLLYKEKKDPNGNGDALIYSIIHDLKIPISNIKYLILEQNVNKQQINNVLCKLDKMLDAVSEYYRLNRIKLNVESVDLNEVIIPIIQEDKKYNNVLVLCDKFPTIKCDKILITRTFYNIISNAHKYRSERPLKIIIKSFNEKKFWKFQITDNGIGINDEEKEKVFDIFYRSKQNPKEANGEGIGLPIVKAIIKLHGGKIQCENNEYGGTTFSFTISKKL